MNEELESINKPSKFDLIGHWFVLVFIFLHILLFSWASINTLSDYRPNYERNELVLGFALVIFSLPIFFGVLRNKRWGYFLTIILAIVSILVGLAFGAMTGSSDSSIESMINYLAMYAFFINPFIALAVIIFSTKLIIGLNKQKNIN